MKALGVLVNLPQGEELWKQIRRVCLTGTEAYSVLNPDTWDTLDKKKKTPPNNFKNKAMSRGNDLEPIARASLARKTGVMFRPAVFMSKKERMMASLDGIAMGRIASCEIKCPEKGRHSDTWSKALKGVIPHNYLTQMQYGMLLSGAPRCYYWVYDDEIDDGVLIIVEKDPFMHKDFLNNAREYWATRADRANKTVVYNDDGEAEKLAKDYAYWKKESEKVESRLKEATEGLKKHVVEAADITVIDNVELTIKPSKGSVDYKKALFDLYPNVDLEQYRREPKEPFSISIKVNNEAEGNKGYAENAKKSA